MKCKIQNLQSYSKVELEELKLKNIGFKIIALLEKKGGVKKELSSQLSLASIYILT